MSVVKSGVEYLAKWIFSIAVIKNILLPPVLGEAIARWRGLSNISLIERNRNLISLISESASGMKNGRQESVLINEL